MDMTVDHNHYFTLKNRPHDLLAARAQQEGVPMSVIARRAVLKELGVYADGTPREDAK